MAHFRDGDPCTYFDSGSGLSLGAGLRAIGWLEARHRYPRGEVVRPFVDKLIDLLVDPWQPVVFRGVQTCNLCRSGRGVASYRFARSTDPSRPVEIGVGHLNLFVPGKAGVFASPTTIIHYIDAHGYAPPADYVQAVLDCPPMRSEEYLERLAQAAPLLVQFAKRQQTLREDMMRIHEEMKRKDPRPG